MLFKCNETKKFIKEHEIPTNKRLLIWEMGGFTEILRIDLMLATAMRFRGYKPYVVVCDGFCEACIQRGLELNQTMNQWPSRCRNCRNRMYRMAKRWNAETLKINDYVKKGELKQLKEISLKIDWREIQSYKYLNVQVGRFAFHSINRYMRGCITEVEDLKDEGIEIYRRYFFASLAMTLLADRITDRLKPDAFLGSHGVYTDYAPARCISFGRGIPTTICGGGYKERHQYFCSPTNKDKLLLQSMADESWEKLKVIELNEAENKQLDDYFHNRYFKKESLDISVVESHFSNEELRKKLHITNKNIACLFCHIGWDACFDDSTIVFDDAYQWVIESLKVMIETPEIDWIIRVHPAENDSRTVCGTVKMLEKHFSLSSLPSNIRILNYDSDVNSYDLFQLIDCGITALGTVGVELPCLGKPVIAAGKGHFSEKGFTYDCNSQDEYLKLLKSIADIPPLSKTQIELARRYAYIYFIRRQIPLRFIKREEGHWGNIDMAYIQDLLPGKSSLVEKICDGISNGTNVIMDEIEFI